MYCLVFTYILTYADQYKLYELQTLMYLEGKKKSIECNGGAKHDYGHLYTG